MKTDSEKILALVKKTPILRSLDLASKGISRATLSRMVKNGTLERTGRGLYQAPGAEIGEFHTFAEAAKKVPHGIVSLLSALRFHGITTQAPFEVWIAVDRTARKPHLDYPPVRVVRFSGEALTFGVEDHKIEGVLVRVTTAAKTVADCFKYRNKIGLDVAVEALKEYRRIRRGRMDDLWRAAEVCRVSRIIRPYLDMIE